MEAAVFLRGKVLLAGCFPYHICSLLRSLLYEAFYSKFSLTIKLMNIFHLHFFGKLTFVLDRHMVLDCLKVHRDTV